MAKILVIDDSPHTLELLDTLLRGMGHEVVLADGGHKGLHLFQQERPHGTILDLMMPDVAGLTVLKEIRALDSQAPVIILTGFGTIERKEKARELGAAEFLQKGLSSHTLRMSLDRALTQRMRARYVNEQRLTPRFLFHFPIAVFQGGAKIGDGTAYDLSRGGCAIWSPVNVEKGDHVALQLSLPDEQHPTTPLKVEVAEVRWTIPQMFGLKFISLASEDQQRLHRYLTSLQATRPRP